MTCETLCNHFLIQMIRTPLIHFCNLFSIVNLRKIEKKHFEPGSKISSFYSQGVFIVLWADFLCQQYSEVTIKRGCGQEKPFTGALSGWKSSKDTLYTFPPLLHPCAFVLTFLTCFLSHLSFISHISVQTLMYVTSLDTYSTLSISQANEDPTQVVVLIKLQVKVKLTSCHPGFWSNSSLPLHGHHSIKDLGSIRPERCPFHLAWDDKVAWSQCPRPPLSLQAEDDKVIHGRPEVVTRR